MLAPTQAPQGFSISVAPVNVGKVHYGGAGVGGGKSGLEISTRFSWFGDSRNACFLAVPHILRKRSGLCPSYHSLPKRGFCNVTRITPPIRREESWALPSLASTFSKEAPWEGLGGWGGRPNVFP